MSATEIVEIKCGRWQQALDAALKEAGKSLADAESAPKGVEWKFTIARKLRTTIRKTGSGRSMFARSEE